MRSLSALSLALIGATWLAIEGCVVNDVSCEKSHFDKYRTIRTFQHIQTGEACQDLCSDVVANDVQINYFTWDASTHRCLCSTNCLIDRGEEAKGDVSGLISDQDPSELCPKETGAVERRNISKDDFCVFEKGSVHEGFRCTPAKEWQVHRAHPIKVDLDPEDGIDAILSMTTDNKARIIPVSAGSYCNDPDNFLAANAPDQRLAKSFNPTALPVGIFMADQMILCGGNLNPSVAKILCFYYETRYPGWLDMGVRLLPNPSRMSAATFPNGSTWLLGGSNLGTNQPLLDTNVLTPDHKLLKSFDLPLKTKKLCAVALGDMQVFIADGIGGKCFLYDSKVDGNTGSKWTELPNLPATRPDEVLCALAKNNGDPLVIVDGWTHDERTHPTHIFHVASQTWSNAQGDGEYIFPFSSGLFTHGQTVLSAAGYVKGEDGSRQVNKWNRAFDVNTGNWLTVGNPVDSVGGAVHIPLPKSFGACKPKK